MYYLSASANFTIHPDNSQTGTCPPPHPELHNNTFEEHVDTYAAFGMLLMVRNSHIRSVLPCQVLPLVPWQCGYYYSKYYTGLSNVFGINWL